MYDNSVKPYKTTGVQINFINGSNILLGTEGNDSSGSDTEEKVKHICIENTWKNSNGTQRSVCFYDENNRAIDSMNMFNPTFEENVPKQTIETGYELIGVSLTIESGGAWLNFLLWPENQPIF